MVRCFARMTFRLLGCDFGHGKPNTGTFAVSDGSWNLLHCGLTLALPTVEPFLHVGPSIRTHGKMCQVSTAHRWPGVGRTWRGCSVREHVNERGPSLPFEKAFRALVPLGPTWSAGSCCAAWQRNDELTCSLGVRWSCFTCLVGEANLSSFKFTRSGAIQQCLGIRKHEIDACRIPLLEYIKLKKVEQGVRAVPVKKLLVQ